MVVEPPPAARDFTQVWAEVRARYDGLVVERLGFGAPLRDVAAHALDGGKRLRPLLAELVGPVVGAEGAPLRAVAVAVEYLHTASVLLDDLPCMDDARERRGAPPAHVRFTEAEAILAAVALVSRGYACLAEAAEGHPDRSLAMVRRACETVAFGMAPGQALELGIRPPDSADTIRRIHEDKTASLFRLTAELTCLCAGATDQLTERMVTFATLFGRAYQIADDVADRDAHGEERANLARLAGAGQAVSEARALLVTARGIASLDARGGLGACVDWLERALDAA